MKKQLEDRLRKNRGLFKDTLMNNLEDVKTVFPMLSEHIDNIDTQIKEASCTSCKKNKLSQGLILKVITELNKEVPSNHEPITKHLTKEAKQLFLGEEVDLSNITFRGVLGLQELSEKEKERIRLKRKQNKTPAAISELPDMDRISCIACCCKHVAQASILMQEMSQGYPEHLHFAKEHITRAKTSAPMKLKNQLEDLEDMLNKLALTPKPHRAYAHLKSAQFKIDNIFKIADPLVNVITWKVIGHLAEAADECSAEHPKLSALLREERLHLMEDYSYIPPFSKLLRELELKINPKELSKQAPKVIDE